MFHPWSCVSVWGWSSLSCGACWQAGGWWNGCNKIRQMHADTSWGHMYLFFILFYLYFLSTIQQKLREASHIRYLYKDCKLFLIMFNPRTLFRLLLQKVWLVLLKHPFTKHWTPSSCCVAELWHFLQQEQHRGESPHRKKSIKESFHDLLKSPHYNLWLICDIKSRNVEEK